MQSNLTATKTELRRRPEYGLTEAAGSLFNGLPYVTALAAPEPDNPHVQIADLFKTSEGIWFAEALAGFGEDNKHN